jgi:acyl carrier protein
MIPEHLVFVDEFPLNSSGKIDKTALPAPQAQLPAEHVVPATLIETMMASLYATLLDLEEVGATDSFFDLGGNSLKVMRLIQKIDDQFDVGLDVASVFLAPTPRQLAALLRDKHGYEDEELGAGGIDGLADVAGGVA